jgi:sortase A
MKKTQLLKFIVWRTLANALIGGSLTFLAISLWPLLSSEFFYYYRQLRQPQPQPSLFNTLAAQPTPLKVEPVSKDFGIIIEKIGVNAPIVADVDTTSNAAYMEALRYGVAHAKDTAKPNEVGNVYLFAHSTLNFWEYGPYATVFTLLHQMEPGDRVVLFYQGQRYDYRVIEKEIVPGFDLTPLERKSSRRVLTLQTCDPPGTTWRRLLIIAERV